MKFGTDIHGARRMHFKDFGDPLTLFVVPPTSQSVHLSGEIFQRLLDGLA